MYNHYLYWQNLNNFVNNINCNNCIIGTVLYALTLDFDFKIKFIFKKYKNNFNKTKMVKCI